ncbi:MAG: hypothetical protein M0042_03685 [Nitrospiraceae bacterium]|nr:hypothetical protein [Nitrospiraceae bacterium]
MQRTERFIGFLASRQVAITLFLLLSIILVPTTITEQKEISLGWLPRLLFGGMALNLLLCTAQRIRTLARPVLVIHAGVLVVIIGATMTSFGYVETVNVHEGSSTPSAFRWDREADVPLGYDLAVRKIHKEYIPFDIQVGVFENGRRAGLYTVKTGGAFALGEYTVRVDALDLPEENLNLTVLRQGAVQGTWTSDGEGTLPEGFPYAFELVAYKTPVLTRMWVDLQLTRDGQVLAEGTAEVNGPFDWNGLRFYHTLSDYDLYGLPYAGIQIVKDPGRPAVYAGFVIVMAGAVFWMIRRFRKQRPPAPQTEGPKRA